MTDNTTSNPDSEEQSTANVSHQTDSDEEQKSVNDVHISDQPTFEDYLGFQPYVTAIATFLTNPKTQPPLTIAIEGEWGSGKSSFMKQLHKAIERIEKNYFDNDIRKQRDECQEKLGKFKDKNIGDFHTQVNIFLKLLSLRFKNFKPPTVVWFNAWRHDKAEALWAAFALEFIRQISRRDRKRDRSHIWIGNIKLFWQRLNWNKAFQLILLAVLGFFVAIALATLGLDNAKKLLKPGNDFWKSLKELFQQPLIPPSWVVKIVVYVSALYGYISYLIKLINLGNPQNELTKYLESPNYKNQIAFIEDFHEDFRKIVEAFAGEKKVYIFIDDLDRCEIPKSAELMQAINMMIANDPQLIFILGMDVEKVAAGIAVKHRHLTPYLGLDSNKKVSRSPSMKGMEYAYTFLEKFIQIRFQIPQPTKSDFDRLFGEIYPTKQASSQPTKTASSTSASNNQVNQVNNVNADNNQVNRVNKVIANNNDEISKIAQMVTPALDYNPRRWKQFINLFRLKVQIATYTGLFSSVLPTSASSNQYLTLEQLGKFTAISVKWPRLLVDLNTDRQLLADLQKFALTEPLNFEKEGLKDTVKYWGSKQKLVELLRYSSDDNKSNTLEIKIEDKYSFAAVNTDILLQVASQDNLSSEVGVNYTKLRDLLAARNWEEADYETYLVMLQAVGREKGDRLRPDELLKFPCTDLHTIDRLWVKYSSGRFGFSVQKNIYLDVGGKADSKHDYEAYHRFGDRVGRCVKGNWIEYEEMTFETSAPTGHLPTKAFWWAWGWDLFYRIEICKL